MDVTNHLGCSTFDMRYLFTSIFMHECSVGGNPSLQEWTSLMRVNHQVFSYLSFTSQRTPHKNKLTTDKYDILERSFGGARQRYYMSATVKQINEALTSP